MQTVLKNVNIIDIKSKQVLNNYNILIEDGKVKEISKDNFNVALNECKVYDLKDKYLIPGIINMHQHYFYKRTYGSLWEQLELPIPVLTTRALKNAIAELKEGITTARVMGSLFDIDLSMKLMIEKEFILGPRLIISGQPLGITGSHAQKIVQRLDSKDDYRKWTRERVRYADWVKVFASFDPIDPIDETGEYAREEISVEELKIVVNEAHKAGKKVAAHTVGTKALNNVIEAGIDSVEHGVYLTKELAVKMKEKNIALIPTLTAYTETCNPVYDRGSDWIRLHDVLIKPNQEGFKIALEEGVKVGMGLDSLGDLLGELKLMKRISSLDNYEILKICTLNNAEILGLEKELGTIEEGKIADMVVLDTSPVKELDSIKNISYVIKSGKVLREDEINLNTRYEDKDYNSNIKELLRIR